MIHGKSQHDGYINVWNWKQGIKLACNKITTKVHTLAFNRTGSFFVTAGLRHVKFWYFDSNGLLSKKPVGNDSNKITLLCGIISAFVNCCYIFTHPLLPLVCAKITCTGPRWTIRDLGGSKG